MKYGCDEYGSDNFYKTCRKPDRIPEGKSWVKCNKNNCPYFPKTAQNITVIDKNGNVLFSVKEATIS